ncbi:MAG: Lysyl-tRNA synthetase (class II), partial [uncultured Actinomycetospora sp.]
AGPRRGARRGRGRGGRGRHRGRRGPPAALDRHRDRRPHRARGPAAPAGAHAVRPRTPRRAGERRPRAALVRRHRARPVGGDRAAPAAARRPAGQAQAGRVAGGGRGVGDRRRRPRPQGAAPGGPGHRRRPARAAGGGARAVPGPRRPAVAAAAAALRPGLPRRGAGLRVRLPGPAERADDARPDLPRRAGDDLRWPRGARRALRLRAPRVRRDVPRRAARARGRRAGRLPRPAVPPPDRARPAHPRRLDPRPDAGAHLRLGHPRGLRAARRQELLLRLRRPRDDRLHLPRRLRPGRRRPDRRRGVPAAGGGRVPGHVRPARLDPRVPRRPRGGHPRGRSAGLAGLPVVLPRRRGDHRLPVVHARGARAQERARRGAPRGAPPPLPAHRRVGGLAEAGRGAERDLGEVAGQGPGARVHDVAVAGHHRLGRQQRLPALRRPRRRRGARRLPAPRSGLRRPGHRHDLRVHAGPHAPRPGRAERHDRVPHREERPRARRAGGHAPVDELRDVGPAVRRGRAVHGDAEAGPPRGGCAQPVLPGPLAARLQREVRAAVAAARAGLPQPGGPAAGRPALRRRRGLPRRAGPRAAVRPGGGGRRTGAVDHRGSGVRSGRRV